MLFWKFLHSECVHNHCLHDPIRFKHMVQLLFLSKNAEYVWVPHVGLVRMIFLICTSFATLPRDAKCVHFASSKLMLSSNLLILWSAGSKRDYNIASGCGCVEWWWKACITSEVSVAILELLIAAWGIDQSSLDLWLAKWRKQHLHRERRVEA